MESKLIFYSFIIFLIIYLLASAIFVFENMYDQSLTSLFYALGKFCGLVGFLFLSILIILGDSARYFDRFFGMDKIILFQRKFSLFTTLFVLLHPIFFLLSGVYSLDIFISWPISIGLGLGVFALFIYLVFFICSVFYKLISYNLWQYLHLLSYVLFLFSFFHAFELGTETKNIFFKAVFYLLALAFILAATYRFLYKLKNSSKKFFVKTIKWQTKDVFTLSLIPNEKFNFKPGQFCFLRLNDPNLHARHPFTISSSPYSKQLDFTIKLKGKFTYALSKLKKAQEVFAEGPFGRFLLNENTNKELVFIAGGVGITPFFSMIMYNSKKLKKQKIVLLYSIKTFEDIIFYNELKKLQNENWIKIIFIFTRQKPKFSNLKYTEFGRINLNIIKKYTNYSNSLFYICGPEELKKDVIKILKDLGVDNKNILLESFFW